MGIAPVRVRKAASVASTMPKVKTSKLITTRLVDAADLDSVLSGWETLAGAAVTPNVFYEPWVAMPALRHLASLHQLRFLLVFGPPVRNGAEPLLGFFPLEIKPTCLGLPVKSLTFWQHDYCFLATPLVHRDHITEAFGAFWRWFETNPLGCRILDTNHLSADGPFHHIWSDFVLGRTSVVLSDYPRATLTPIEQGADAYVARSVTRKHHDEFRRLERRLAEVGVVTYERVDDPQEVDRFIADFLAIELQGWKGTGTGGAFGRNPASEQFFRDITIDGFVQNRVMLLALKLDGKRIAVKHNLMTAGGGFTFKIAFDESFAKYSPGLLLELENIRHAHADLQINWLDSCAAPRHPMANRIWSERRMIRRTLISNGSAFGDLFLSALPLLRWVKHRVAGAHAPGYFQKLNPV